MSTKFLSPGWRMPRNANQSKSSNYSLDFDASSDTYIDLGIITEINGLSNFSFSVWIKPVSPFGGNQGIVFGNRDVNNSNKGIAFALHGPSLTGTSYVYLEGNILSIPTGTFTLNQWSHVVITYDNAILAVYVDNSLINSVSLANQSLTSTASFNIGRDPGTGAGALKDFNGQIANVSIFDYALSASQVTTLWGGGTSVSNPMALPSPPVAYYPLGGSAGAFQTPANNNDKWLIENNAIGDYVFDFNANYIDLGDSDDFSFTDGSGQDLPFTLSAWVNMDDATSFRIITKYGTNTEWYLYTTGSDILRFRTNDSSTGGYIGRGYSTAMTSYENQWIHIVGTYDGSESNSGFKLYINATKIDDTDAGSVTPYDGMVNSTDTVKIGKMTASDVTNGKMSNVQIFNTALSGPEVETLYNYSSPIRTLANIPQNSNLKAWYKLDATEIYNSSSTEWEVYNNAGYEKTYSFNGSNNIQIPNDSSIQTSAWTIGFWVKGFGQNGTYLFNNSPNGWNIKSSGNDIGIYVGSNQSLAARTATNALNGKWNYIVFSYDGGNVRGSLNGGYLGYDGRSGQTYDSSNLFIGSYSDGTNGFVGEIGQILFWNTRKSNAEGWNSTTQKPITSLPAPPSSDNNNLVSWWKLDAATITDSFGSNTGINNGAILSDTIIGRPTVIGDGESSGMTQANLVQSDLQTVAPYSKYAMSFDGTDSATVGSLFGQVQDVFSVSTWVNFTSNPGYQMILSDNIWFANYTANNIGLDIKNSSGNYYDNNGGLNQGTNFVIPSNLRTNKWINIAFSYAGSSSGTTAVIKMYLNGVEMVDTTVTYSSGNANLQNASNVYLGSRNGTAQFLNGSLSNLSIWNYALTVSQVREIYNQGLPSDLNNFSGTAPVAWWQLGENSSYVGGWTFADEIASNNGTSGNLPETALTNGVGTTANGTSTGMAVGALVGDAPYSTANAISSGMSVVSRVSGVSDATITTGGTGYSTGTNIATTGGSGTNCTINITTVSGGAITAITINSGGNNYLIGDVLTVSGGNGNATITVSGLNTP